MTAILALLGPKVIGIMALVLAALGWGFQQRLAGAKAERAKQAKKEAEASDIGHQVDNDLSVLTPAQRRERLKEWSKD